MKWYDDPDAIGAAVTTLAGLNELMSARHAAYYDRKERLREWIVLGQLYMDTCGNTMRMDGKYSDKPVISRDEMPSTRWSAYMGSDTPDAKSACPSCGRGWSIDDWHDAKRTNRDIDVEGDHVGKTVQQVHDEMNEDGSGRSYYLHDSVQNDNLIDLRPNPKYEDDEYMKGYPINERGYKHVSRDYVVEEGDKLYATVFEYFHLGCLAKRKADNEFRHFADAFADAGFKSFELMEVPNEYCSDLTCCPPWYKVDTEVGEFKIGWRKRVINIVWPEKLNALPLFEDQDVTKWATGIHAWGVDKAVEYLKAIREFALEE